MELETGSTHVGKIMANISCELNETKKEVQELKNEFNRQISDKDREVGMEWDKARYFVNLYAIDSKARKRRLMKLLLLYLVNIGDVERPVPMKTITHRIHLILRHRSIR